jgi:EmrB/QacA subfamily drug resistance transporter
MCPSFAQIVRIQIVRIKTIINQMGGELQMSMNSQVMEQPDSRRWWALMAAALGIFMVSLDMNILNVALPTMSSEFHVTRQIAWVSLSYTLAGIAAIPIAGRLSDVIGRKRIFLWGIVIFLIGSALCGTAATLWQMVLFRVIQGIGGAGIAAPIGAIATVLFPVHERGKAMGTIGIIGPLGGIAGPSIAGFLVDQWGWNSVFFLNIPVGLLSLLLLWRLLPADTDFRQAKFDFLGTFILSAGSLLVLLGLTSGQEHVFSDTRIWMLAAGVMLFLVFPLAENRMEQPIIPVPVMKNTAFSFPLIGILTSSVAGSGIGFLTAFFLQLELGLTPTQTGLTVLFFPLAMMAAAQMGGTISDRLDPRLAAGLGTALYLVGLFLFATLDPYWSMMDVAWRMFLMGFSHGLFIAPSNVAVMAATPREYLGVSSAIANLARSFGFALGPALATAIWMPGAADARSSMQMVVYLMMAVQVITFLTTYRYTKGK